MSGFVITAVLFGALLHAAWNVLVKSGGDKWLDVALLACASAVVSSALLPFLPSPAPESWPYIIASAVVEVGYFALVAAAYRTGELSYVYPIMRGSAPLLTALAAGLFVTDRLTAGNWFGILLISAGLLLLPADQWWRGRFHVASTLFAFSTAVVICIYTLIDGIGSRLSGNAFTYVACMMSLNGFLLAVFLFLQQPAAAMQRIRASWLPLLGGGLCAWASYAIALWAMTRAPIAMVAALRETSVIFGSVLAAVVLKEKFSMARYAAALLVCAGAISLKAL
ncbi:MAG TPA: DMT family transporter [Burkholderiales bacterium]|nr:DMT family transporter [Burkholderiales bacterium]